MGVSVVQKTINQSGCVAVVMMQDLVGSRPRAQMTCTFMIEMHKHTWAWPKINLNLLHFCSCASPFTWQGGCKHYSLCELASSFVLKKIETRLESGLKHLKTLKQLHNWKHSHIRGSQRVLSRHDAALKLVSSVFNVQSTQIPTFFISNPFGEPLGKHVMF